MYGDWYSWIIELIGIVLTGVAVKMMDDWLDIEYDQCVGRHTVAARLGKATLPYTLLILALGIYISPDISLALFLSSYSIGMGHDLREVMPSKLPGWAESLAAFVLGMILVDPVTMVWALMIIGVIQFIDDLMDIYKDTQSGQRNSAVQFGVVEVTLLTVISFLIAILLRPEDSVIVLLATPFVHIILEMLGGD